MTRVFKSSHITSSSQQEFFNLLQQYCALCINFQGLKQNKNLKYCFLSREEINLYRSRFLQPQPNPVWIISHHGTTHDLKEADRDHSVYSEMEFLSSRTILQTSTYPHSPQLGQLISSSVDPVTLFSEQFGFL